jgi:hypothetical protein
MSEASEAQFRCIGCGALNTPGAETCVGCGHRFAGPDSATPSPVADQPKSAALSPSHDEPYYIADTPPSTSDTSIARLLVVVICWIVVILITGVALLIAFFTTCIAVGSTYTDMGNGMVFGSLAGGVVVLGLLMTGFLLFKKFKGSARGKPR